jgi:hypothetical protein
VGERGSRAAAGALEIGSAVIMKWLKVVAIPLSVLLRRIAIALPSRQRPAVAPTRPPSPTRTLDE